MILSHIISDIIETISNIVKGMEFRQSMILAHMISGIIETIAGIVKGM